MPSKKLLDEQFVRKQKLNTTLSIAHRKGQKEVGVPFFLLYLARAGV